MSLWANYIREIQGDHVFENEAGFATYRYLDTKTVYIIDIYVHPDHRRGHLASSIADTIVEEAKAKGCTELMGTVVASRPSSTESVRVLLGYGFRIKSADKDVILFSKEI